MGSVLRYLSKEFVTLAAIGALGFYAIAGIAPQPHGLSKDSVISSIAGMLPLPQQAERAVSEKFAMVGKPLKFSAIGSYGGKSSSSFVTNHGPIFLN